MKTSDRFFSDFVVCPVDGCKAHIGRKMELIDGQYFIMPLASEDRRRQTQELLEDHYLTGHSNVRNTDTEI